MPVRINSGGGGSGKGYYIYKASNVSFDFGNAKVTITWTDPGNSVINGNVVAEWIGTIVVRNTDHYPVNAKDGIIVVDSKVKNQYKTNGFIDTGVENGVEYFYSIFTYSKQMYSSAVNGSGTPKAVSRVLAENSWDVISSIAESGKASQYWSVGDEIDVSFGTYGTYTFQIYGFNIDDKSNGSGKAGITFGMKHLTNSMYKMNNSNTNSGSWNDSVMRKTTVAGFWNAMQNDVKAIVKTVKKITAKTYNGTTNETTQDNLFLFAYKEVGLTTYSNETENNALSVYPIFTDNNSRIKKMNNGSGSANYWWLRSPRSGDSQRFCCAYSNGSASYDYASYDHGVVLGFCV